MQGSFSTTKSDAGLSFCSVSTVRYVTEKIFKSALQSIKSHQYSFLHMPLIMYTLYFWSVISRGLLITGNTL